VYDVAASASGSTERWATKHRALGDPTFLRDGVAVSDAKSRLATVAAEHTAALARWEELETLASELGGA